MKTSQTAVLVLAAVGAVQIVQRERHQWQQNEVAVARIQNDWLTHLTTHPDLAKLWAPQDMDVEEYVQLLHANQHICALSLRHRLGPARGSRLRFFAQAVMEREIVRRHWARFGSFREQEAAGGATSTPKSSPQPCGTRTWPVRTLSPSASDLYALPRPAARRTTSRRGSLALAGGSTSCAPAALRGDQRSVRPPPHRTWSRFTPRAGNPRTPASGLVNAGLIELPRHAAVITAARPAEPVTTHDPPFVGA